MTDQERPWVMIVIALIGGGSVVAAAMVPLYCAKQNRLVETTSTVQASRSEIEQLKRRISQNDHAIASKDTAIAQLRETEGLAAPASVSRSLPFHELPELRVEVEALQEISNNRLVVWLRLTNRTQNHLGMGLDSGKQGWFIHYPTFVVDDKGNEYRLQATSGLNDVRLIPPAGEITVTLTFTSNTGPSKGSSYSLSSDFALYETDGDSLKEVRGKPVQLKTVNVSLRSIRASN